MKRSIGRMIVGMILVVGIAALWHVHSVEAAENQSGSGGIVVAVRQANSTFDPSAPANAYDTLGRNQIYDTLVCKNEDGEIIPSLAERYEFAEDGMSLKVWLKKNIKFTNGQGFTAEDVKYSIERAMGASSTSNYFSSIEKVEIINEYTVIFKMREPNASILEILFTYGQILHKETALTYGEDYGQNVEAIVGTGPYIVEAWKPNEEVVLKANSDYFKGIPDIQKAKIIAISDANAAIIALQTGEVDLYMDAIPAIHVKTITNNKNLVLTPITSKRLFYVFFNNEDGPFADIRLRKAVALAIDRNMLLQVGSEGLGTPVNYVGASDYIGNPNIKIEMPRDLEKAKELVREAGMEGEEIDLMLEHSVPIPSLATCIQNNLGQIGLDVAINSMEVNTYLQDVWAGGKFDMAVSFTTAKTKDMDTVWSTLFNSKNIGAGNSARYSNEKMDEVLDSARAELDENKREKLYEEAIKIYEKDLPLLALFYEYSNRVYTSDLEILPGLVEYDNLFYYNWK